MKQERDDKNRLDPLESDADDAYDKITSYMRIIKRNICDMFPKAIALFIIQKLQSFIKEDLLIELLEILDGDNVSFPIVFVSIGYVERKVINSFEILQMDMFKADEGDIEKFKTMKIMHETYQAALDILSGCGAF